LGVNQSTVSRLFRNVSITTFQTRGPRRVYKHTVTNRESRRITRLALKLRRITTQDLINELDLNISRKTIIRILRANNIRKRIARTKPHLTQSHMSARLEWAKLHESWTVADWAKVIWSDESSIQVGFDSRQMFVFRRPGEELLPECLRPSFKSKRVNIMVWGCFKWDRLGPLIICESGGIGGDEYFEILSDGLLSFVDDLLGPKTDDAAVIRQSNDVIFMHDGAPCHKAAAVVELLAEEELTVMKWPAQSPDLNPIENVWQILKTKFHKRFTDLRCSLSKSEDAIEKYGGILKEVWNEINPTVVSNLIRSMPGRVQAVIKAKGGAIRY
jgi:hypothetical protein